MSDAEPCCSFCLKSKSEAAIILTSFRQDAFICDGCVSCCNDAIKAYREGLEVAYPDGHPAMAETKTDPSPVVPVETPENIEIHEQTHCLKCGEPSTVVLCEKCRDALEAKKTDTRQLRYAKAQGQTFREMQENIRRSNLYQQGDAILVWVNEGDLWMLSPVDMSEPYVVSQTETPPKCQITKHHEMDPETNLCVHCGISLYDFAVAAAKIRQERRAKVEQEKIEQQKSYWCGVCGEPVDGPDGKCPNIGNEDHKEWR